MAARVELDSLLSVGFQGLVLLAIVMFIARPLSVWVSSMGSNLKTSEKMMISWIGPRGIVAAAISSLFAIRLQEYDIQGVELLVPLVFMVIIGTVLIQGLGAKMVGNLLGVREPASNGVLIVGSNPVALKVAEALQEQGFDVLVAHNNYTNISKARMSGLRTYFGNPISDHADRHLDLIGIGHLFAMSTDKEMNTLSELHYRHEFGEQKIYRLKFAEDKTKTERESKRSSFNSRWLFGKDVTYTKMASMLSKKARVKITNITDSYSYNQYRADNKQFVPLFTIDKEGHLHVITDSFENEIPRDHKLVALVIEDEVQPKPVDVTEKQNQARALADLQFKSTSKSPEKRKEKTLSDDVRDPMYAPDVKGSNEAKANNEIKESVFDTELLSDKVTDTLPSTHSVPVTPLEATLATKLEKKLQKQTEITQESAKPTKSSASRKSLQSQDNGNSQAPRQANGSLDPERLPDTQARKDSAEHKNS